MSAPKLTEAQRELARRVLQQMLIFAGYAAAEGIIEDYLDGESVLTRVGRRGVMHLDCMMAALDLPVPSAALKGGES